MEAFRALVELWKIHLWASDVAAAAAGSAQEFHALLRDVQHHAAARALWSKPLDQPLARRDIQSATAFLERIYSKEEGPERNWGEKVSCFKQLRPESLAVAIVLCNGDKALRHSTDTIRALCQGAEEIAKWSHWPYDPRLKALVQKSQQQAAASAATSPAQPAQSPHATPRPGQLALKCSSCGALSDLELTYKQATGGPYPNRRISTTGAASTNSPTPPPTTPAASTPGDRSNQPLPNVLRNAPLPPTNATPTAAEHAVIPLPTTPAASATSGDRSNQPFPSVPGIPPPLPPTNAAPTAAEHRHAARSQQPSENESTISIGRKRRREEDPGSALEGTAIPQAPTSQPHRIESRVPFPDLGHTGPGPTLPADPQTLGWCDTRHRLRDFFAYIREHFPETVQLFPESFSGPRIRYVSPAFVGIWFQVTPSWLEARGLLRGWQIKVSRSALLDGITDHLQRFGSYGFVYTYPVENWEDPENWVLTTYWFVDGLDADGQVWPVAFGELVVKWLRPGFFRDYLLWLKMRSSRYCS
ncbi:hypothetical protein VTK56DRAFT_6435 [Thermocarpiscus australiensis]